MIVGTIAASADQSAFARTHQSIHQKNKSSQSQECHANGGSGVGVGSGLLTGIWCRYRWKLVEQTSVQIATHKPMSTLAATATNKHIIANNKISNKQKKEITFLFFFY